MKPDAEARARIEAARELSGLFKSAYAKMGAVGELSLGADLFKRAGLTPDEITAVLGPSWQAEKSRQAYESKLAETRMAAMPPKPTRTLSKPRIGPKMRAIADYVAANPGQSISDALWAAGISPRDRSSARAPIYRAEAAGLVIFDPVRVNLTRVFANEDDRQQYYADRKVEELSEARTLADVVSALPGCSKAGALRAADVPVRVLNMAIDAGLVLVDFERANLCRLFATERDKKIFYLRHELLQPGTSAGRIAELQAEIDTLRAEAAQTWTEA